VVQLTSSQSVMWIKKPCGRFDSVEEADRPYMFP
jgi:hypothetical protein